MKSRSVGLIILAAILLAGPFVPTEAAPARYYTFPTFDDPNRVANTGACGANSRDEYALQATPQTGSLWQNATVIPNSGGWAYLSWFGFFNTNFSPWIYHQTLGWLYPFGTSTDSIWFFDPVTDRFLWTGQTEFPYIYSLTEGTWLFYGKGSSNPCWFYNFKTGKWQTGQQVVNGVCGGSNNGRFISAPTANLCITGNPSPVEGTGPWHWTCQGVNGGTHQSCEANAAQLKKIYTFEINGLTAKTGDLIGTVDGGGSVVSSEFWELMGKFIPGEVDHIAIYIGPGGRFVEAGPKGVIVFETNSHVWDSAAMYEQRGLIDRLYGIAYPLSGLGLSAEEEERVREIVAGYSLAQIGKPYNFDLFNSGTEESFYCSQLAYKAFLKNGIDLNTGNGAPAIPGTAGIIFPQEVWESCFHMRPVEANVPERACER